MTKATKNINKWTQLRHKLINFGTWTMELNIEF
jgi:hypothetical protein